MAKTKITTTNVSIIVLLPFFSALWPRIHIMLLQVLDNTGDQLDVMSPLIELGSLLANTYLKTIVVSIVSWIVGLSIEHWYYITSNY